MVIVQVVVFMWMLQKKINGDGNKAHEPLAMWPGSKLNQPGGIGNFFSN